MAVYPVPDEHVGDQVMAAAVLRDRRRPVARQIRRIPCRPEADLSAKAWPRYVWITDDLPATATNKVLKRELIALGAHPEGGGVVDPRRARSYLLTGRH